MLNTKARTAPESQREPGHSLALSCEFQHQARLPAEMSVQHGQGRVQLARRFAKASGEKEDATSFLI